MMVKILLIDDHQLFREGLRAVLGRIPEMQLCGEAPSAREGLRLVEELSPDVVVIDLVLPGIDGLQAIPEVLRRAPAARVLVLTAHSSEPHAAQALSAGALGFAIKDQPAAEVIDAIRRVAAGERYLAPRLSLAVVERYRRLAAAGELPGPLQGLTERQREIFLLLARGFTNEAVASELCISPKTVETHRAQINRKLGVRGGADLVRLAARHGLILE